MSENPLKKNELLFVFFYLKEKDKYLELFKKMIVEKIENSKQIIEGVKN